MLDKDARGDLAGFERWPLETWRLVSESESCGDCSGSSGVGVMRRARCSAARQSATYYDYPGHLYAGAKAGHCTGSTGVVRGWRESGHRLCCFRDCDREQAACGGPQACSGQ